LATAYDEAVTVKTVFGTPYGDEVQPGQAACDAYKPKVLAEAKKIAADMKNQDVKDMVAAGKVPEIVALIAYLNRLK
jgi:cytochrome c oxidase cbb3-type subunit 2